MVKTLTINDLFDILRTERIKGNGEKKILITTDDEGNGCHQLFYGVSPTKGNTDYMILPYPLTREDVLENYVLLG